MKLQRFLSSTAVAAALLCAGAANAAIYQFTVTGDYSASWQLDTDTPPDVAIDELGISYYDITGTFPGASTGVVDVSFFAGSFGGGMSIDDFAAQEFLLISDGPQIYTGSVENPGFATGSYALTEYQGTGTYTLTISAVPEPATYGMMLGGLALVGVALRRRQGK